MLPPPRELEFLKFFDGITQHLRSIREPRKALAHALRDSREFFQATRGCIAVAEAGESDARLLVTAPRDATWDLQHIGRFIRHTNPPARSDLMMAPVRRRGAAWAALSLMRAQPAFGREDRRRLARITTAVSEAIHVMDRERLLDVRDRIDRKIMEQIHPKDLYDYATMGGGRAALIIADVVGHGVSAAMLTGVVKSAFRASDADEYEPAAVVQRVRGNLSAFGPERFVTLIAAVLAADGELRYVNAGHPAGLLWSADGAIQRLTSTGPLVSPALPPCTWEQETVALAPGDQLLLYTDGISDTLAGEHDLGDEPLVASIEKHREGGVPLLDALLSQVRARLAGRPQTDDLTLLTAKVLPRRVADRISGIRP